MHGVIKLTPFFYQATKMFTITPCDPTMQPNHAKQLCDATMRPQKKPSNHLFINNIFIILVKNPTYHEPFLPRKQSVKKRTN